MRIVAFLTFVALNCAVAQKKISPLKYCDCGIVPDKLHQLRIVGGVKAEINEFPWTVGLYTHHRCRQGFREAAVNFRITLNPHFDKIFQKVS